MTHHQLEVDRIGLDIIATAHCTCGYQIDADTTTPPHEAIRLVIQHINRT